MNELIYFPKDLFTPKPVLRKLIADPSVYRYAYIGSVKDYISIDLELDSYVSGNFCSPKFVDVIDAENSSNPKSVCIIGSGVFIELIDGITEYSFNAVVPIRQLPEMVSIENDALENEELNIYSNMKKLKTMVLNSIAENKQPETTKRTGEIKLRRLV